MINNEDLSPITGERLKNLRKDKKISAEKLSEVFYSIYSAHLDRTSISNYEHSNQHHSHPHASNGMNVSTLRIFADYYGVSADYILGLTDVKSQDTTVQAMVNYTGLEENSISSLHENSNSLKVTTGVARFYFEEQLNFVNSIVSHLLSNDFLKVCGSIVALRRNAAEAKEQFMKSIDSNDPFDVPITAEKKKMLSKAYRMQLIEWFASFLDEYFSEEIRGMNEAENQNQKALQTAIDEKFAKEQE